MNCSVDKCDRQANVKGQCSMHYLRAWRAAPKTVRCTVAEAELLKAIMALVKDAA